MELKAFKARLDKIVVGRTRVEHIDNLVVPDCYHVYRALENNAYRKIRSKKKRLAYQKRDAKSVLDCWHLCEALLRHLKEARWELDHKRRSR